MNKYLSDKLRIISLLLMTLVVLLHSYKADIKFAAGNLDFKSGYNFFIQLFFSEGIARIAVPLFFCMSGYLFFSNFNGTIREFILKYKKRTRSLLVPFLLWSIWGLVFYFILQLLPQSSRFFTKELIMDYSFTKTLHTILLNPIPYQLWFLRDLIILVIISPLIYWMIRHLKAIPVVLLFIIWLGLFEFNFLIFRAESIFFFATGAYLAIYNRNLPVKRLDQKGYLVFAFLWIITVALKTILIYQGSGQMTLILFMSKLGILSGIMALWSLYDIVMKYKTGPNITLLYVSAFSFFIYGFHEPVLTIVQKGLFYVTGAAEVMITINYILAPAITLILSIAVGSLLKRYLTNVYRLMSGGR